MPGTAASRIVAADTMVRRIHRNRGYVHVYTGDGKGKTTAALGLSLRAAGAGLTVLFAQFLKGQPTGELAALKRLTDRITVRRYGRRQFLRGAMSAADIAAAQAGLADVRTAAASGQYNVVILDEACVAVRLGLLSTADLLHFLDAVPRGVEVVFTGRGAPAALARRADLVTEMKCVKHYFAKGIRARRGIER